MATLLWSFLLFLFVSSSNSTATGLSVDGVALIAFKGMLVSDPLNALEDWNVSQGTPCAWSGVSCANVPHGTLPRVVSLSIEGKGLAGSLPVALGALDQLRHLDLQGNKLIGTIPEELFNATFLRTILLGGNHITGTIPGAVGRLISLQTLDMSSNRLTGSIPHTIAQCTQLRTLLLNNNSFSGPIPSGLGTSLASLKQLDLSANHLSGQIPADLGKLSSLQEILNLSFNHLFGPIPASLGDLPYTVSLDLSHNNLTGRIPQDGSLAGQGPEPFLGNPGLCGFPLTITCPTSPFITPLTSFPTEGSPPSVSKHAPARHNLPTPKKAALSTGSIVAIVVGDAIGISMVTILFVYVYWKARIREDNSIQGARVSKHANGSGRRCFRAGSEDSTEISCSSEKGKDQGELVPLDQAFTFEMEELLRASAYVLGKGERGIVYKVVLGNGTTVAVRRLGDGTSQRQKMFQAEVQAISRVRHPNVVKLLAYYWAEDEKLLMHDFIPNGSLAAALNGNCRSSRKVLTWMERLKIASGAACGLAYIHDCSPRKYVHGDVKTSKILLDATWQSFVADFGVAKLATLATQQPSSLAPQAPNAADVADATAIHSTHITSSSSFYQAPEAAADAKPSQKWDVFSFGVVLMELLSGRSAATHVANHGSSLVAWMRKAMEEGPRPPLQVLDAAITESSDTLGICAVLDLAMICTSALPNERPKMKLVADCLGKLAHSRIPQVHTPSRGDMDFS